MSAAKAPRRRAAPEVLDLPAPRAVRLVARWLAEEVEQARGRVRMEGDRDAVHDLRVALRRLRSWVRAWRPLLRGTKPRRAVRELGELADLASPIRDAEVMAALLDDVEGELGAAERPGARALRRVLRSRAGGRTALADAVDARWVPLRARLLDAWAVYDARMRIDGMPADARLSEAAADAARAHAKALASAMRHVDASPESAHEARIAGKRLRYLLEPLEAQEPSAGVVLEQLRALQKELGELNDLVVLERAARDAPDDASADGDASVVPSPAARGGRARDPGPGLAAVRRIARDRAEQLTKRLAREWTRERMAPLLDAVDALAAALRERAAADVEIERKFLLRALPPEVRDAPVVEMSQGYVPGRKLVERLRHVRGADGERWYRTVKLGRGMARAEFEEETTREVFEAMWPLTRGRRVTKRRYEMRDGALTWEVDDFTDRALVLAEVELHDERAEVPIPEWLARHLVREVTSEGTYQNSKLAK